jgi:ribosomal protein S27AE
MLRLKCKKCGSVFEQDITAGVVLGPHIGPLKRLRCPACGKGGWFNVYSSVKDPVTWPKRESEGDQREEQLSDEELEKKRMEESKYESI